MLQKILIGILLCLIAPLANGKVILTRSSERIPVGRSLLVFQPQQELSFKKVLNSHEFIPVNADVPNFGLSRHSLWLKFTVTNTSPGRNFILDVAYPLLKEVELYSPSDDGKWTISKLSKTRPFGERRYHNPAYLFDLTIRSGVTRTYFLRVTSDQQIFVPLYISRPEAQFKQSSKEDMLSGIYTGIVLIMIFYNLFVYFSVRDKSYLYYVIYIFFVGLTQVGLKGYNFQYLWPGTPVFESMSVILFASVSGISALLFTEHYLGVAKNFRKARPVLWLCIVLFTISCILTLSGNIQNGFMVMQSATSLSSVAIFITSLTIMLRGYQPAKFFFSAWSVLLAGAVIFMLKDYQILPYNTFTSYSMQAASAIEMALLSFGLANRINILKREKEISQAEALRVSLENERIIREQNVMLEQKVNERTQELKESNEELNVTLENLKQAQSQLVESEKMASLGQLTAGIAHEINNPINFVTSNVTPLKRDVDMLLDALSSIESTALTDLPVHEKQKYIEDLKEELDFDYLKVEIEHLLKGIHEGASRTAEIVKGLRIFSRVDEDDLKRADINEGLESTLVIINNLLNNKIRVTKEFGNIPLIECYPGKLNQVFLNIMTNAVHAIKEKFGDAEGGELQISTYYDDAGVFVKITDNGTGMDENTQKKIFEPFFTTKEVGEGTGLGMSIAYNTIMKHNGQIHLTSGKGKGTTFILELPVLHKL